jgi:tetratricopeptide (TPR) repeat protein
MKPERKVLLLGALIVVATLAAYHGIFSVPFVFDDFNAVTLNPTIRHLWPPWDVLRTPQGSGSGADGRPIANLSFAISYAIGGTDPRGYHAFSLAAHALAALALFGVLRRTLAGAGAGAVPATAAGPGAGRDARARLSAFLIALLWAVHPLQTESVTTVVHRTEILVSLFYLLTLYCFIRSASEERGPGSGAWAAGAILACALGMASKEVMVSAPLIVFLYDRTFVAGTFAEAWRRRRGIHAGLACTWAVLVVLRVATPGRGATGGFGQGMSPWHYALTQCRAIIHYIRLAFWPHPLVLDYGNGLVLHAGDVLPQGLLLIGLLAGTVVALNRKPALGFAGACFFAILGPSSSFVPLVTQTMAEHRMYLPLAAVLAVAVLGLQAGVADRGGRPGRIAFGAVLIAAAAAAAFATARRNAVYQNSVKLWTDTVDQLPNNTRPHDNLANALLETGRIDEAIAQFQTALRIDPGDAQAHYNLGGVYMQLHRLDDAIGEYEAAVRDAPRFAWAHDNLGTALIMAGRYPEALEQYAEAVQADPEHAQSRYNLANLLVRAGRLGDAIGEYQAAIRLAPEMADAHFNLAQALAQAGHVREAIAQYEIVLRLNPADNEARANLARLRAASP